MIEDLELFHLCSIDYKKLVVETMYAAYRANELSKRSEILYEILKRSERNDVTMEMIMQCSEELPEFEEFLELWIQYLGKQSSVNVERLLKEALGFVNNENKLLEFARENYVQHPGFYEQYIFNNLHCEDKKSHLLEIGKEALEKIDKKYVVRSRIALMTSQVALNQEMQKEAENAWLEAFRSDTRVVNYLRLFLECVDFSDYKDEVKQIRQNMHLKNNRVPYTAIEELKENLISDKEFYMLAFLEGEFTYVKEQGMNVKDSLGWSVTFMKCGVAAFLLLLLENENLQQGCKEMCRKIVSEVKFEKNEYENGLIKEIDGNSQEWFWNCFCRWKNTIVLSKEEKSSYMQWIEKLVEKPLAHQAPSNLAIMGRYVLTPDIFDKIDETEPGVGGEIQLTDALQKLDEIYGVTFEGKTYDIGNRFEWLKTSIEFAMEDVEFKDDLIEYMKEMINGA